MPCTIDGLVLSSVPKIRFGLVCDGESLSAWQNRCIDKLLLSGAELSAIIIDLQAAVRRQTRLPLTYRLLARLFSPRIVHARSALRRSEYEIVHATEGARASVDEAALECLRRCNLDFIMNFDEPIDGLQDTARLGVWSFVFADRPECDPELALFWSIADGDPVTTAQLVRRTGDALSASILREAAFRTWRFSWKRHANAVLSAAAEWPALECSAMAAGLTLTTASRRPISSGPHPRMPTAIHVGRFFAQTVHAQVELLRRIVFTHAEWNVGLMRGSCATILAAETAPLEWLPSLDGGDFLADPFTLRRGQVTHILCERYDAKRKKGEIAHIRIDPDGTSSQPMTIIDLPIHLSYPFLIEQDEEIYCVPEMSAAREVGLFRAIEFPNHWEKVATLLSGFAAVDSTIFQHEGRYWLFCGRGDDDIYLELFAFYSQTLQGPWFPHMRNPVKMDVRSSRPAGTPFTYAGALYRPAQDCSETYGSAIVLNHVLSLTPEEFVEEPVAEMRPQQGDPYPAGLHTVSFAGDLIVIDGLRRRFGLRQFFQQVAGVMSRARSSATRG